MAVAAELAGRAIAARGAGLKAVWGLQARRAGTCPTLGVTGAVVATAAGLVTLGPPHSWGARCKGRRLEGVTKGLTPPQRPGNSSLSPSPTQRPMPTLAQSPHHIGEKQLAAMVGDALGPEAPVPW